ncbi:MAG TPA: hypothetical protein VF996_01900 [Candidatus Saccharimonadales bacterium]
MQSKILRGVGVLGLIIILASTAAITAALVFNTLNGVSGRETLFSAFGGAFFAYIFVRIGGLFNRLSKREKLNLDTVIEQQYVLNDHLNRIDLNIRIADALIELVGKKSKAVYTMRFKPVPIDKSNLRDMKNLDFINDMFNYYVDLEKINDGLDIILEFSIKLVQEHSSMISSGVPDATIQQSYAVNSNALMGMIQDSKNLLKTAEHDCVELIAKSKYVYEHRNIWLSLAYPGRMGGHYGDDIKEELPELIAEIEKSRNENEAASKKKIEKTLGKKIK